MPDKKKAVNSSGSSGSVITIDFAGVETGKGRVHVPESDYGFKIKTVAKKIGEDSGKDYLDIGFELVKGDKRGIGKVLQHNCSLQKQSLWNLRNLLESCGKTVPAKAVKIDLKKLVGLTCAGTVIDDEYEGRKKSVISAFFPMADLGKTSDSGDELEESTETVEEEETVEEAVEEESDSEELFG
jgi:hypothetical protein